MNYIIQTKSLETTEANQGLVLYEVEIKACDIVIGSISSHACGGSEELEYYDAFECLVDEDYLRWSDSISDGFKETFPERNDPILLVDSYDIESSHISNFYRILEISTFNIFPYGNDNMLVIVKINNETQKELIDALNENIKTTYMMSDKEYSFYCISMAQ